MCILCGNPSVVHESAGSGITPAAAGDPGQGDPIAVPAAAPPPTIVEAADAAGNTSTTYTLGIGQTAQGQLSTGNDHDWYRVDLVAGQTYTLAMTGTGTNNVVDPYLRLYASNGTTLVAQNDDSLPGGNSIFTYTASTTGTYFIDAAGFNDAYPGQYGVSVAQGSKAFFDVLMGAGVIDTDLSWSPTPGTGATVTYGFRASPATYTVNGSNIGTFTQFSAAEMAAVQTIMQFWSEVCGVTFTQVNPGGNTDNATILFGNYRDNDNAGAFAFYPGSTASTSSAGDVWANLNSVSTTSLPFGSYSFNALMHEVGHTLGLSHPGMYNAAPGVSITYANNAQFIQDSQQFSVMSYFDESNTGASFGGGGYPDTPLLFDIYAVQQIYGANLTTRTGDTVYGFGGNAGSVYDFSITSPNLSIWDAGGNDTLNCANFSQNQLLDLIPGTFSNIGGRTGNVSIALGVNIETAVGGAGADTLIASALGSALYGGAGNDTLNGGVGNDLLDAGPGADTVNCGGGDNTVMFRAGSGADSVTGFVAGGTVDRIDLTGMPSVHDINDVLALASQVGGDTVINFGGGDTLTLVNVSRTNLISSDFVFAGGGPSTNPDLTASNAILNGNSLSFRIDNIGNAAAAASMAGIFLSTDSTITTADTLLTTYSTPSLSAGASDNESVVLSLPANLAPGTYYIGVIADQNGQIVEGNEANNVSNVVAVTVAAAAPHAIDDFNGDAKSDLLLRNDNGAVQIWFLNGGLQATASLGAVGNEWHIAGTGDFNGDSKSDVLWRHDNGSVAMWLMNGGTVQSNPFLGAVGNDWHIALTGDFNGDSKSDVLWRNDNGAVTAWLMNGGTVQSNPFLGMAGNDWHIVVAGDFNGDSKSDVLWRNDNGGVAMWLMNGGTVQSNPFLGMAGNDWHIIDVGDFNGDSKSDVLWRNDNGAVALWLMNGETVQSNPFLGMVAKNMHIVDVADINGDSKSDIIWRSDAGALSAWLMNGEIVQSTISLGAIATDWHIISHHYDVMA